MQEPLKPQEASNSPPPQSPPEAAKTAEVPKLVVASSNPEKPADGGSADTTSSEPPKWTSSRKPSGSSPLEDPTRTLLMALGATVVAIGVIYNFSGAGESGTSDEVRSKLKSVSTELQSVREAKAAVDKTLAETQAKLAAEQKFRALAEKAVGDAKALLGAVPLPEPKPAEKK
jgi:hypothetical protein